MSVQPIILHSSAPTAPRLPRLARESQRTFVRPTAAPRGRDLGQLYAALAPLAQGTPAGPSLAPQQAHRLVADAAAHVAALEQRLAHAYAQAPVAHAAAVLARSPGGIALARLAAARAACPPQVLPPVLGSLAPEALLAEPPVRGYALALQLRRLLPAPLALMVLTLRLRQLETVNAILRDWAEALAKWAALDKAAQQRWRRQAQLLAQRQLAALQVQLAELGVQLHQKQRTSVAAGRRIAARNETDALMAAGSTDGDAAWRHPLANASLLSALTLPLASGVAVAGRPVALMAAAAR